MLVPTINMLKIVTIHCFNIFNVHLYGSSQKNLLGYTYNILSLKLLADKSDQIIKYDYFPASQFRACFALECVKPMVENFATHTYFDVYAPYELGASISDDVEPIFAVLNNIVSRGLPTKPSLMVERTLSEKLRHPFMAVSVSTLCWTMLTN